MKFLSTRELRNRPGFVRDLAQKEDLVLTANGKPIAKSYESHSKKVLEASTI